MTDLLALALEEYTRQHERATLAVARTPALRDRAEATCRAWLSIVLRLGGTHPHAAPLLAEEARAAPEWTAADHTLIAAHRLAPLDLIHKVIAHARDQAFAVAIGHTEKSAHPEQSKPQAEQSKDAQTTSFQRFNALKTLARRLGCLTPVRLPAHPEPVEGPEATPQRKAA